MSSLKPLPSVSAVIPTYNRAHTLATAIESCQRQTHPLQEIIAVDDGSSDETSELMKKLMLEDPRLRYLRLDSNHGAQYARIEGIKICRSPWIVFVDSDDELLPEGVEACLRAIEGCGFEPALVYGDLDVLHLGKTDYVRIELERFKGNVYPELLGRLATCFYSGLMVRKECFDRTGYPDPAFQSQQDRDTVYTLAKYFPILHCGSAVSRVKVLANRITANLWALAVGRTQVAMKYWKDIVRFQGIYCFLMWHFYSIFLYLRHLSNESTKNHRRKIYFYFYRALYHLSEAFRRASYAYFLSKMQ